MESSTFTRESSESPTYVAESSQTISNWFPYPEYLHLFTGSSMFEQVPLPYGYNPYPLMHMNVNGVPKGHPFYMPHFQAAQSQETSFNPFSQATQAHMYNAYHVRNNEHVHIGPDQDESQEKGHEDNGLQAAWYEKRNNVNSAHVDGVNLLPGSSATMYTHGRFNGISANSTERSEPHGSDEVDTASPDPRPRSSRQSKGKRIRTTFNGDQLKALEDFFSRDQYIGSVQRMHLARALGLSESQVKIWWQNRRIKERRAKKSASRREFDVNCNAGASVNVNSTTSWMMPNHEYL